MKKDKAAVVFRRCSSVEVTGEIIDDSGAVVEKKSFGVMTEAEYRKVLKLVEQDNPDVGTIQPIEVSGN